MKMHPSSVVHSPESISSHSPSPLWKSDTLIFASILLVSTVILYLPAFNAAFVNYDDPAYVTRHAHVLRGLSWNNIAWSFTATVEANWHPLTWISHMAEVQMFGLNPLGHHLVSVLLHAVNVLLLFFVLRRATGFVRRSAIVAALFSVDPFNVGGLGWVGEGQTPLSMLFFVLA